MIGQIVVAVINMKLFCILYPMALLSHGSSVAILGSNFLGISEHSLSIYQLPALTQMSAHENPRIDAPRMGFWVWANSRGIDIEIIE